MAHRVATQLSHSLPGVFRRTEPFPNLQSQWKSPSDVFSILLILGGDIIHRALAQLVGSTGLFTPVAFSFGWVAYAVSSVVAIIGTGRLMPPPDYDLLVVNAQSGYARHNNSWVLGRVLRDWPYKEGWKDHALVVTVVRASQFEKAAVTRMDRSWIMGVSTIIIQIVLSTVPGILYNSWSCLAITLGGTLLCIAQGAIPQWSSEKWACRNLELQGKKRHGNDRAQMKTVILTQGNGSRHTVVVISEGKGLDLEDLGATRSDPKPLTAYIVITLAAAWVILLLTASGIRDNSWFLLLVGGLGSCQNIYAAGCKRNPKAYGMHFKHVVDIIPGEEQDENSNVRIVENKVFAILQKLDEYNNLAAGFNRRKRENTGLDGTGLALLPIYFPGGLRPEEQDWKAERIEYYKKKQEERDCLLAERCYIVHTRILDRCMRCSSVI